jgi:hypothetical protein
MKMTANSKEYMKNYYTNNKDKYNKYSKLYICECGMELRTTSKTNHLKTKNHKILLDLLEKKDDDNYNNYLNALRLIGYNQT